MNWAHKKEIIHISFLERGNSDDGGPQGEAGKKGQK